MVKTAPWLLGTGCVRLNSFARGEALAYVGHVTDRIAARTLCNFSLRTASGPEGSSAK